MNVSNTSSVSSSPHVNPYQELFQHVTLAAAALQKDSAVLDTLVSLPTLSEEEQTQLNNIYARMDSIEAQLLGKLNPSEWEAN